MAATLPLLRSEEPAGDPWPRCPQRCPSRLHAGMLRSHQTSPHTHVLSLGQKPAPASVAKRCVLELYGAILFLLPPSALGKVQEPRHSLRSCCSPCCSSRGPAARGAGPARTRASLAAVPGLFPKSVRRRVVSSSPKGPTLQQIFSMSSAYINTGFDVCGITHIHVCFLPCFFREKRKGINDCQFIPVSQHLRACSPGRTASTCSRTHTCLPYPEDNKYLVLDANDREKLKRAHTDDLVSSS